MDHSVKRITRATYRNGDNFVAAASAAAFLVLKGVAGKVGRVKKITLSGLTLTAVAYQRIQLFKYSALPTGGTSTNSAGQKLDTNSPAPGLSVDRYTVAPAGAGTSVVIGEKRVLLQATTAAASGIPGEITWTFADSDDNENGVIRGAAEGIGVAFPAAPATAVTLSYDIEWTEDGN